MYVISLNPRRVNDCLIEEDSDVVIHETITTHSVLIE